MTSACQHEAVVVRQIRAGEGFYRMVLSCPRLAARSLPGQFLNVKVSRGLDPLLRRPLSIHRVNRGNVELLYRVVGEGTQCLANRRPGDRIDVLGPLGRGFDISARLRARVVIVGGGMGVAPLLFLAQKLTETSRKADEAPVVLIGAKTKRDVLCEKEFKGLGCEVRVATDDGSRGFKGTVTAMLAERFLPDCGFHPSAIYACGPHPMMREVAGVAASHSIPCQISLEAHMACGFGVCLGCVVVTRDGYRRVCHEGPVFDARDIVWEHPARGHLV